MIDQSYVHFRSRRAVVFLICLSNLLLLSAACRYIRAPAEEFVMRDGFKGGVVVVFDQPDGIVPVIVGDVVVYPIPDSGVLKARSQAPRRNVLTHYYNA